MPIPIRPIKDQQPNENNSFIDYSFLLNQPSKQKIVTASNEDAASLFKIWKTSKKTEDDSIEVNASEVSQKDLFRLKALGFLQSEEGKIKFTKKGKGVITTMVLGEPNKFELKKKEKNYNEILASMSKKNKTGYRLPK